MTRVRGLSPLLLPEVSPHPAAHRLAQTGSGPSRRRLLVREKGGEAAPTVPQGPERRPAAAPSRRGLTEVQHGGAGQVQRIDAAHDGHGLGGSAGQQRGVDAGRGRVLGRRRRRAVVGVEQQAEAKAEAEPEAGRRRRGRREAAQLAAVAALQVPPALLEVLDGARAGGHGVHLVPDQLPHAPLLARRRSAWPGREQQLLVLQHLLDQHLRLRLVEIRLAPLRRVLCHPPPAGPGPGPGPRAGSKDRA